MPWCHTCRVEYAFELDLCPECDGSLTDRPAPERRSSVINDGALVLLTTLPAEQALWAAGRLDADGIPNALRDTGERVELMEGAVDVLVQGPHLSMARDVLRVPRRVTRRSRPAFMLYVFLATVVAFGLSAALLFGRWFFTGSPMPR